MPKTKVPALGAEGWFDIDEPALIGSRCTACGTVAFPAATYTCPNPACRSIEAEATRLSRRGKVWSATDARYPPPAPFVPRSAEHEPFAIAAVELADEQLVVLGQVADGVLPDQLPVGTEVELVVDTLFEDDDHEYLIWKWRKVGAAGRHAGCSHG